MNQTEREYREALDGLRFSEEAKERMMKNLMEQMGDNPMKRKKFQPLRTGLIAAAACAALVGTAAAANVLARQASVQYLDREQFDKEYNEYLREHGYSSPQYSDGHYTGMDFRGTSAEDSEAWWQGPGGTLVEEKAGTAEDGWTAKRVFQCRGSEGRARGLGNKEYLETRYRAGHVSDFGGLWDCWDVSWLEEHYDTNPNWTFARTFTHQDTLYFMAVGAEYQGDGDARFNMIYSWDRSYVHEDVFYVAGSKEYEELYTTPDGVVLAIEMDTSSTGKSVFWVSLGGGHSSFDMFGTQMELSDLHELLDSLNLSKLLEYNPAE